MKILILLLLPVFAAAQKQSFNNFLSLYPHKSDTAYIVNYFKSNHFPVWHTTDSIVSGWWNETADTSIFTESINLLKGELQYKTKYESVARNLVAEAKKIGFTHVSGNAYATNNYLLLLYRTPADRYVICLRSRY